MKMNIYINYIFLSTSHFLIQIILSNLIVIDGLIQPAANSAFERSSGNRDDFYLSVLALEVLWLYRLAGEMVESDFVYFGREFVLFAFSNHVAVDEGV